MPTVSRMQHEVEYGTFTQGGPRERRAVRTKHLPLRGDAFNCLEGTSLRGLLPVASRTRLRRIGSLEEDWHQCSMAYPGSQFTQSVQLSVFVSSSDKI